MGASRVSFLKEVIPITVICFDQKILAADSLVSVNDTVAYRRSKIRILKQAALASAGYAQDGDAFDQWWLDGQKEPFHANNFAGVIVSKNFIQCWVNRQDDDDDIADQDIKLLQLESLDHKCSLGASHACSYAHALMRIAKYNAHKACEHAAQYSLFCGLPVYSITQAQLLHIDPDFKGYWIGTYQTPIKHLSEYLITHKQWLKT